MKAANQTNNPAGRLLALVLKANSLSDTLTVWQGWATLFAVEPDDTIAIFAHLGEVVKLPRLIHDELKAYDFEPEDHFSSQRQLTYGLTYPNFSNPWSHVKRQFDGEVISDLRSCSALLARFRPEPIIPQDQLENLHHDVDKLFAEVKTADIDPGLKQFILRHLADIEHAIREYSISGAAPIIKALESAVGASNIRPKIAEKSKDSPLAQYFWVIVKRALLLITLANSTGQLVGGVTKALAELIDPASVQEFVTDTVDAEYRALPDGQAGALEGVEDEEELQ